MLLFLVGVVWVCMLDVFELVCGLVSVKVVIFLLFVKECIYVLCCCFVLKSFKVWRLIEWWVLMKIFVEV